MLRIRKKLAGNVKRNPNPKNTTTGIHESWSNLKDTPGGVMEFNTASKEKCKKKEITRVSLKFEG